RAAVEPSIQHFGRAAHRYLRVPVCYRIVAVDRRSWFFFKPNFRHDGGNAAAHVPGVSDYRLDGTALLRHCPLDWRHCLYCRFEWRHDVAGSEDRIPGGLDTKVSADSDPHWRSAVGAGF